jgi:hypothetical protein
MEVVLGLRQRGRGGGGMERGMIVLLCATFVL